MDFNKLHVKVQNKPDEWRLGQAYFNYAYEMWPEEVEQLRSTVFDCFYVDPRIPMFLNKLEELLNNKTA